MDCCMTYSVIPLAAVARTRLDENGSAVEHVRSVVHRVARGLPRLTREDEPMLTPTKCLTSRRVLERFTRRVAASRRL